MPYGAAANDLPGAVPEEVKEERYQRIMERTAAISAARLQAKVGRVLPVIIDEVGEADEDGRSEEHTSELQSLMRISYAVFCLHKNKYGTFEQHDALENKLTY